VASALHIEFVHNPSPSVESALVASSERTGRLRKRTACLIRESYASRPLVSPLANHFAVPTQGDVLDTPKRVSAGVPRLDQERES
jgi:hypothetical protein